LAMIPLPIYISTTVNLDYTKKYAWCSWLQPTGWYLNRVDGMT
jgi:hypothetical protein